MRYFGFRRYYGLSYRSCQEAHQEERIERFLARMGARHGELTMDLDRLSGSPLIALLKATDRLRSRQ